MCVSGVVFFLFYMISCVIRLKTPAGDKHWPCDVLLYSLHGVGFSAVVVKR